MRAADFDELRALVQDESGIMLDRADEYALETRLAALPEVREHRSLRELLAVARGGGGAMRRRICEAITVNETRFFRDERTFAALADTILPDLAKTSSRLAVWCAAVASGQEAYSVAMVLRERRLAGRIVATDLAATMIERTRAATYTDFEVHRGLDSGRQAKHMIRGVDSWRVHPEVRALVEASTQNLAMPWPARPRFDLILMRNVLVYLAPAVRAAILARTREALSPDGVLVLGAAESGTVPGFDRTTTGGAVFYRSSTRSCHVPPE